MNFPSIMVPVYDYVEPMLDIQFKNLDALGPSSSQSRLR